jgi:hypothetical protein
LQRTGNAGTGTDDAVCVAAGLEALSVRTLSTAMFANLSILILAL